MGFEQLAPDAIKLVHLVKKEQNRCRYIIFNDTAYLHGVQRHNINTSNYCLKCLTLKLLPCLVLCMM